MPYERVTDNCFFDFFVAVNLQRIYLPPLPEAVSSLVKLKNQFDRFDKIFRKFDDDKQCPGDPEKHKNPQPHLVSQTLNHQRYPYSQIHPNPITNHPVQIVAALSWISTRHVP